MLAYGPNRIFSNAPRTANRSQTEARDPLILSAQFYTAALKAHPDIPHEIARGEFGTLHAWLRDNLYRHGSKFVPNALVKRATGEVMNMRPYLNYLCDKYGVLYRLPARTSSGEHGVEAQAHRLS
jgi:hypothetical protein